MTRLAILVYHALLSLYPHRFRTEFEAEMLAVFQDKLAERAAIGWWPQLVVLMQELRDWPINCLQAHWQGRHEMKLPIKKIAKWSIALLALAVVGWLGAFIWLIIQAESPKTRAIALADLDGDGDLDAFLNNRGHGTPAPATVLLNDGNGRFSQNAQQINYPSDGKIAIGDVNNDGAPDIVIGLVDNATVYLNDGTGRFTHLTTRRQIILWLLSAIVLLALFVWWRRRSRPKTAT